MKVIRKEREELEAFKWEGELTQEIKDKLFKHSLLNEDILIDNMETNNLAKGCYIVMKFCWYNIITEQEFKKQYEVVG